MNEDDGTVSLHRVPAEHGHEWRIRKEMDFGRGFTMLIGER
jgi:hypothetical protein